MNLDNLDRIEVHWKDHDCQGDGPWIDLDHAKELAEEPVCECQTVGWVFHETEELLCLVSTVTTDSVGPKVDRILKKNITFRRKLEVV